MRPRHVIPYLVALLLLAWTVGSLARGGTGGTSILANSYWLVYIAFLLPVFALISLVGMIIYLVVNWRLLSDALGMGIAKQRMKKKTRFTTQLIIWATFWAIAFGTIFWKCGTIPCQTSNSTQTLPQQLNNVVANGSGSIPTIPGFAGAGAALGDFVGSGWFAFAFLGLLVVSSVILARSIKVSMDEVRSDWLPPAALQKEGTAAVHDALRILIAEDGGDPRTRIMACYQRMVRAASSLGADVRVDQTARELETGIRGTFHLKGEGIAELTRLFEEARYSLHPITEGDSEEARRCLLEISGEFENAFGSTN